MTRKTALVIAPGRGTYNKESSAILAGIMGIAAT